jgi:hypothetical protein
VKNISVTSLFISGKNEEKGGMDLSLGEKAESTLQAP